LECRCCMLSAVCSFSDRSPQCPFLLFRVFKAKVLTFGQFAQAFAGGVEGLEFLGKAEADEIPAVVRI